MDKWGHMSDQLDLPEVEKEPDRRPLRTKQALIDALISLMAEKHYDAITLKEVADRANVGRSTFYMHYQSKDDLLIGGFERILDLLVDQIVFSAADRSLDLDTTLLFKHASGHYEVFRTLLWGRGYENLANTGHTLLSNKLETRLSAILPEKHETPVPLPVLCYSMAGSLLILLQWWLDNKRPCTPEKMNEIFQQLIMTGIRTTLHLDN